MQIDVSVAFGATEHDVRIDVVEDACLTYVLPALANAVGAPAGMALWCGADLLSQATSLRDPRLRDGARLRFGGPASAPERVSVLALHVTGGPAAGGTTALERGRLTIGRAADNALVLTDQNVSRRHAMIDVGANAITLHDAGSANGTVLNGQPVSSGGAQLQFEDVVRVGDSLLAVAAPVTAPAAVHRQADGTLLIFRSPRPDESVVRTTFTVPKAPEPTRPRAVSWLTALVPAAAGAAIAWFSGQPQFLLFALLSPAMMIAAALSDRLQGRRSRRAAVRQFRADRARVDVEIAAALAAETATRRRVAPDPATLGRGVAVPDTRVWAREQGDPDFLHVRLGTAALPSAVTIRDGPTVAPAGTLADVPLCLDLRAGPLGVCGPAEIVTAVARWLVGQLGALTSPGRLELAVVVAAGRQTEWHWTRWLPHLRERVATRADDATRLVDELSAVIEQRRAMQRPGGSSWAGSWLVVVVDGVASEAHASGVADALDGGTDVGVTAVWLATDSASLPGCCVSVAQVVGPTGTQGRVRADGVENTSAVLDQVSEQWAEDLARNLAPLRDTSADPSTALPAQCTLLTALGVDHLSPRELLDRWAASDGGARSVVGTTTTGPLAVDLTIDGPHALVAGTTGAGKSELLRAFIAGLAVSHPPSDLNVLLIDYKGGAAFADCARLPHTTGLVTDLDPYLTQRALRSLHAELRRRERLFAAAAAADLNEYRRSAPDEPVPRLVIVVDEFAALAEELPEFVSGLVGVARRGRSLGLHLVLATQRPGSAVSPEIRANTGLRIALRVTDVSESRDVIGSPVAAEIDRKYAGRAYLRTGSALTCFQAAHTSAVTDHARPTADVRILGSWRRRAEARPAGHRNDLARLVDALREAARLAAAAPARSPWPPPLPERLQLDDLQPPAGGGSIVVARIDLPDEQRQLPFEIDVHGAGSLLISGTSRSGRTTVLTTLAIAACQALPPHELHLHVVAAAGPLAETLRGLRHCATVLGPADIGLAARLFQRLAREAEQRRTDAADRRPHGRPCLLVLIDGWDGLTAALPDPEAAAVADQLMSLVRGAAASGCYFAVTGEPTALNARLAAAFHERILLRLPDRLDLGLVGVRPRDLPPALPPGRGIRCSDGALLQFAQVADLPGSVAALAARHPRQPPRDEVIEIRPLPERVRLADLPVTAGRLRLGMGGDGCAPVSVDPFTGARRLLVAGPPRSGRTSVLRLLAQEAHAAGISTVVAAPRRSPLTSEALGLGIAVVGPGDDAPAVPRTPALVLVDDCESFDDTALGERLATWARSSELPVAMVVAGRASELATSYRGVGVEMRRWQCGILLCPGPLDGELVGVRLPRRAAALTPGRGFVVGEPGWGALFETAEPVPIQLALPDALPLKDARALPDALPVPDTLPQPRGLPMCG